MNEPARGTTQPRRPPEASAHRDLTVSEAAWVLGESAGVVRRMCEQGLLSAWRVVDARGSSARLRWHIPVDALTPLLRTEAARRRLQGLLDGGARPPRRSRRGTPGSDSAPSASAGSLLSLDSSSDKRTYQRSDTFMSHDRVVKEQSMIDNVSKEAR